MYRGVRVAPGDFGAAIGSDQGPVILSAIGKIKTAIGSVTIARANAKAIHPAVGDFVYEGDLIETGIDGQVGIIFLDGTTFHLYDSARVVLDEFIYDAEKSSNSALLRVTKGMFGFVAGKVATTGRLIIDTPLAKIQNAAPAASIGSLAFIFFLCLIDELEASSQNIALLDDGTIVYKDLEHGIFEIVTKERIPRVIVVDDPAETIILRLGSSGISVDHVANTPAQMAQLQIAYQGAYATYSQAQQDPFIQQLQQQGPNADQHANAQTKSPGSTSSSGSSTPPDVISQRAQPRSHKTTRPLRRTPIPHHLRSRFRQYASGYGFEHASESRFKPRVRPRFRPPLLRCRSATTNTPRFFSGRRMLSLRLFPLASPFLPTKLWCRSR